MACKTALPTVGFIAETRHATFNAPHLSLERTKGFEPSTTDLEGRCSTS